jgi:hypothetical protein
VILEVLADVGSVELACDANGFEFALRPDAGEHEDLGRTDGSRAEDYLLGSLGDDGFPVGCAVLDTGGPQLARRTFQHHSGDVSPTDNREVRSLLDLPFKEGMVRARPFAMARRGLHERDDSVWPTAIAPVVVARRDPAATAALTNSCAPARTGARTDTPSGPSVLWASVSTTMSPLGAKPSLFLK